MLLKRGSDLQSPWVGMMERNLSRAFSSAVEDGAILQIDEIDSFLRDRRTARQAWEISQTNELLTQLESFDGIFIASTNFLDGLDPAALRRFDFKVHLDCLRPDQAMQLLHQFLASRNVPADQGDLAPLGRLAALTPGDFAVLKRRHEITPFRDAPSVIEALKHELVHRSPAPRRIGFV